jgi:hypothetical protein
LNGFLNLVKHASIFFQNSKDFKSVFIFALASVIAELLAIPCFYDKKFEKHVQDQCCHLVAEIGT